MSQDSDNTLLGHVKEIIEHARANVIFTGLDTEQAQISVEHEAKKVIQLVRNSVISDIKDMAENMCEVSSGKPFATAQGSSNIYHNPKTAVPLSAIEDYEKRLK